MAGRKKNFVCGHQGQGQFCHRCAQEQEATVRKSTWKAAFDQDAVDLRILPTQALVHKARYILAQIAHGRPYTDFRGKRLNHDRAVISVPISRDYRCLLYTSPSPRD